MDKQEPVALGKQKKPLSEAFDGFAMLRDKFANRPADDGLVARLEELAAKATPGPWRVGAQLGAPSPHLIDMGAPPKAPFVAFHEGKVTDSGMVFNNSAVAHSDGPIDERDASVRLIVELVNNLPAILTALRAQSDAEVERIVAWLLSDACPYEETYDAAKALERGEYRKDGA